jgi:hypothetical protein
MNEEKEVWICDACKEATCSMQRDTEISPDRCPNKIMGNYDTNWRLLSEEEEEPDDHALECEIEQGRGQRA